MADSSTTSELSEAIDSIWHSSANRQQVANRLVGMLSPRARQTLVAWDVAALFGPVGGQLTLSSTGTIALADGWGKPILLADLSLASANAPTERILLSFTDTPWKVLYKSGDYLPTESHKHSVSSLLLAMQLIRDHLDSVLLKPSELREWELDDFASQASIESKHFRRLAAWFPSLTNLS